MSNERSVEKLGIIDDKNLTVLPRLSPRQFNANRTRKILLILLSFLFTLHLIYVIFNVHAYIDYVWFNHYFEKNYELLWTLIAVIYDAFGLLVTYNYSRKGLRLFAWMGTILLVSILIVIGIVFFTISYTKNIVQVDNLGSSIFISKFIITTIFLVIIVLLSFRLSKLIYHIGDTIHPTI